MALLQCDFFSNSLGLSSSVNVILPESEPPVDGFKTLWLLHGLSDDHTAWCRYTSIERYAKEFGLAVIMPAVNRSFYTNAKVGGNKYWTYISEELPSIMRKFFKLSDKREDNFVAGLSMGGFGAFKLALNFPEKYICAASFSGALDVANMDLGADTNGEMKCVFGSVDEMRGDGSDLIHILENISDSSKYPYLYQSCGTEDFLYDANIKFAECAKSAGLNIECVEESGDHEWGFWDRHIKLFIDKLKYLKHIT